MKKLLSIILSLALIMSMSMTAFAADVEADGGSASANVTGTYNAGSDGGVEYSVDIEWSGLNFTYNEGGKSWNATTHTYDTTEAGWAESDAKITVTNHSNAAITATPTWTAAEGYSDVTMTFANESDTEITSLGLDSAELNNAAVSGTITVTPGGTLANTANQTVIGTVTVTVAGVSTYLYNAAMNTYTVYGANALNDAVNAAEKSSSTDNPATVKLMTDAAGKGEGTYEYSSDGLLVSSGAVVLDLNGHTVTISDTLDASNVSAVVAVNNGATLTIRDTSASQTGTVTGASPYLVSYSTGHLIIDGGSFISTYVTSSGAVSSAVWGVGADATLVINGGSFSADYYCLVPQNTSATIYGGTFYGGKWAVNASAYGSLKIYGGSFTGGTGDIEGSVSYVSLYCNSETGTGATFPGGFTIGSSTLATLLADGAAYYDANGNQITEGLDGTSIEGDVTVKAAPVAE